MGSDKSFNDARVLRSDDTTLNIKQLGMLIANLETGEHNLADLRKLQAIDNKIAASLGDYGSGLDRLTDASQDAARQHGIESTEFREAANAVNDYVNLHGAELASDVIITTGEWDWIKTRWNANSKLVGTRNVRADILAIDDAVSNAKGVKLVSHGDRKSVWVQGEPEPMPSAASAAS